MQVDGNKSKTKKNKRLTLNIYFIFRGLFAFVVLFGNAMVIFAQPDSQSKLVAIKGELGYKKRGNNRYEGFYEKSCGGGLDVVSLLYGVLHFDWNPEVVLGVHLPDNIESKVNIRAKAIPLKTYYQMDSQLSPKDVLKWPIDEVIYKAGLKPTVIGVFGWVGSEVDKKFVPIKIFQEGKIPKKNDKIYLSVRADVDVEKVICRFSEAINGKSSKSVEGWKVIADYVNAGHAVTIELPRKNGGELCVEMKAKPEESGTWLPLKITVFYGKYNE